jgi:hypothetical protein
VSTKIIVLSGLACVAMGGAVWALAARPKPSRSAAAAAQTPAESVAPANDRAMQDRLQLLEARIAGLQQQLAERGQAAPPAAPTASAPILDRAADEARAQEHIRQVEADFEAESRDPHWARETAADFEGVVAHNDRLKGAFQNIECRSSTCRVEMLDDRSKEFTLQLSELARTVGPNLPTMNGERKTRPDGTAVAVFYWSKGS